MKDRIIKLLKSTERDGMDRLIDWLEHNGFFTSPASTKYHGCFEGGLADHSLGVYKLLVEFAVDSNLGAVTSRGQNPHTLNSNNLIIAALLHDINKVGAYIGTEKPYTYNKQQPKGHALLSIARIKQFIELEPIEEMMIRYHMGFYGLNEFYEEGTWEHKTNAEYALRDDHTGCEGLSKEESQRKRYGKSLRNAWYHNPIVKLLYICDELETLQSKAAE